MPLAGLRGIESRPAAAGGAHQLVFAFSNPIAAATASVTGGTAAIASSVISGTEVLVNLTGVTDGGKVTVTLTNITDASSNVLPAAALTVGFLLGDVNRDGVVNALDTSAVRSLVTTPGPISSINVTGDLKLDGKLTVADSAVVKANLGHSVAP
jgi:hypothetical protein